MVGMKINQIEEMGYRHSTVVLPPEEAFPGFEKLGPNKFGDIMMRLGKISDDMDIAELKREKATGYIYR